VVWGLRDYKLSPIVLGGHGDCEHEWESRIPAIRNRWGNPDTLSEKQASNRGSLSNIEALEFNQSNFCSRCGAWRGSFGLEPHPQLYVEHLAYLCRLLKRVLKKTGSLWLNLGDTYFGGGGGNYGKSLDSKNIRDGCHTTNFLNRIKEDNGWLQPKQKLLIPERVAIALQEDAWILRNDVCWHKPNHMPSSVKDRLTNSWEHLYFFVKSRKYFFDLDSIRQPHKTANELFTRKTKPFGKAGSPQHRDASVNESYYGKFDGFAEESERFGSSRARNERKGFDYDGKWKDNEQYMNEMQQRINDRRASGIPHDSALSSPLGKNPSDTIVTRSLNPNKEYKSRDPERHVNLSGSNVGDFWSITTQPFKGAHFAVYPERLCEMPIKAACPKDGVILDPMCGSGTTLLVARKLCRNYIGIELNPAYVEMARKRIAQIPERIDNMLTNIGEET